MDQINLQDYGLTLYFMFMNSYGFPTAPDPRIGSFELSNKHLSFDVESNGIVTIEEKIPIKQVDFINEKTILDWYDGSPAQGVFTAVNAGDLKVQGGFSDLESVAVKIHFVPCSSSQFTECAEEE